MMRVPNNLAKTIIELWGEAGQEWLNRLPASLHAYSTRWSLEILPPFENLSYNYVAPAIQAGVRQVVLKMGVPNPELLTEIEALRIYDGEGSVRMLEADPAQGILLLERLFPGTPLLRLTDDEAVTSIAAQVMRQLWKPAPTESSFPSVAKWAKGLKRLRERFNGSSGPFPEDLVQLAETLFPELINSMAEAILLHGDLHYENILAAERRPWLAIDPKGVIGEKAYEAGALLRNPLPQLLEDPNPKRILRRRVQQLAEELGFERERLVAWGLAQAILSGWWNYEDHGHGWEPAIACAEILSELI